MARKLSPSYLFLIALVLFTVGLLVLIQSDLNRMNAYESVQSCILVINQPRDVILARTCYTDNGLEPPVFLKKEKK